MKKKCDSCGVDIHPEDEDGVECPDCGKFTASTALQNEKEKRDIEKLR